MGPDAYITPPIIGGGGGGGGTYIAGGGAYIGGGTTGTPIGGGYIAGGTIGAAGYAGYTGATGATGTTGGTAPLMIAAAASVRRIVQSCEKKGRIASQSFTHTTRLFCGEKKRTNEKAIKHEMPPGNCNILPNAVLCYPESLVAGTKVKHCLTSVSVCLKSVLF